MRDIKFYEAKPSNEVISKITGRKVHCVGCYYRKFSCGTVKLNAKVKEGGASVLWAGKDFSELCDFIDAANESRLKLEDFYWGVNLP